MEYETKKPIFVISLIVSVTLLMIYSIVIYSHYNDEVEISKEVLFQKFDFAKELFSNKKIDKILFNIDTNDIVVYFPSEQPLNIIDFFTKKKWSRFDDQKHIKFYNKKTVVYFNGDSIQIEMNRYYDKHGR